MPRCIIGSFLAMSLERRVRYDGCFQVASRLPDRDISFSERVITSKILCE
jgi:hypothetical protein